LSKMPHEYVYFIGLAKDYYRKISYIAHNPRSHRIILSYRIPRLKEDSLGCLCFILLAF
jgi:hypothetical protein